MIDISEILSTTEYLGGHAMRFPQRSRFVAPLGEFVSNQAGRFFLRETPCGDATDHVNAQQLEFELKHGFAAPSDDELAQLSHRGRVIARRAVAGPLDYLILVPTLRCNLACSYCQVSRAALDSTGFDWSEQSTFAVERLLDGLETTAVKIEFQGGEPTLRLDLVERIIARCERFAERSIVICTNLSKLTPALLRMLENPDVSISTSLDGGKFLHGRQRTKTPALTDAFYTNLEAVISRFGPDKISALPTLDQAALPDSDALIDAYLEHGIHSIHLRPVNYQGFARKRHPNSATNHDEWWAYHEAFVHNLIVRNFSDHSRVIEEFYFSLCLRRMFRIGLDRHVDLRNPSPLGFDYLVVDFDGKLYPTDEARMLARSGIVDLSIGHIERGIDGERRDVINANSTSIGDPACDACTYQPFCGRDLIDDISRYGRIDMPRHETFFCQKQLHMFDLCVRLIFSEDPAVRYSLARWLGLSGEYLPVQARLA